MFLGECIGQLRAMLDSFSGTGILEELLLILAVYAAAGGAGELLVQRLWPRRWVARRHGLPAARGAPALLLGTLLHCECGISPLLTLSSVPVALGVALAIHMRWGRPLAFALAAWTLWPALPSEAPPLTPIAEAVPAGPSFAVIVLDTVRRDHTSDTVIRATRRRAWLPSRRAACGSIGHTRRPAGRSPPTRRCAPDSC